MAVGTKVSDQKAALRAEQFDQAEELLFSGPARAGFAKALYRGEFRGKAIFPYPELTEGERPAVDLQVYFEGTFSNARNGAMLELMGTDATLYVDRGRYEVHPERDKGKYEELVLGTGKRGRDFYDKPDGERLHLENWLQAVRGRHKPAAPVEAGIQAAAAAHLANEALRTEKVASWKG